MSIVIYFFSNFLNKICDFEICFLFPEISDSYSFIIYHSPSHWFQHASYLITKPILVVHAYVAVRQHLAGRELLLSSRYTVPLRCSYCRCSREHEFLDLRKF
jgi:hypothetical protein